MQATHSIEWTDGQIEFRMKSLSPTMIKIMKLAASRDSKSIWVGHPAYGKRDTTLGTARALVERGFFSGDVEGTLDQTFHILPQGIRAVELMCNV